MRIHVTKLNGEEIFGSLNIGKLERTELVSITGKPVFKTESGELVYCSEKMPERIQERLAVFKSL